MPSFVVIYCILLFKCKVKRLIPSFCTSQGGEKEIGNRKGNSRQMHYNDVQCICKNAAAFFLYFQAAFR